MAVCGIYSRIGGVGLCVIIVESRLLWSLSDAPVSVIVVAAWCLVRGGEVARGDLDHN